jgi:hypothetical protein
LQKVWRIFSTTVTISGLIVFVLWALPVPFFEHASATLMLPSTKAQVTTAWALASAIGKPGVELNTPDVERYLFSDGTSVDTLPEGHPWFTPMYTVIALKTITLSIVSGKEPLELAREVAVRYEASGYKVQIVSQPDRAFADGNCVLVLSDALQWPGCTCGPAILIRKNALRMGGPRPTTFKGF